MPVDGLAKWKSTDRTACLVAALPGLHACDACFSSSVGFDELYIQFVLYIIALAGQREPFPSTLNHGHAWLHIAGNLRVAGSHHKAISYRCVTNDMELPDHHLQLLGNQLIIANRNKSCRIRRRTTCNYVTWKEPNTFKAGNQCLETHLLLNE